MTELFIYSIKSSIVLILLYLPYTIMMQQERFFRLNRMTLLSVLCLALVLPLCKVPLHHEIPQITDIIAGTDERTYDIYLAEMLLTESDSLTWGWLDWSAAVYMVGLIFLICLRLFQLWQIRQIIQQGCLWKQRENDGITIYCHTGDELPFSWINSIVINQNDYNANGHLILTHERCHIHCMHSLDILFLTIVKAILWWNPIIYLFEQSLRNIHEYEADSHVLSQDVPMDEYQRLLLKKSQTNTSFAFANNFNKSQIKKRIIMMKYQKSAPWMRSKVLYILPMTLCSMYLFATPDIQTDVANNEATEKKEIVAVAKKETFVLYALKDEFGRITGFSHEKQKTDIIHSEYPIGHIFINGREATYEEAVNYKAIKFLKFEMVSTPNGTAKWNYKDKQGIVNLITEE